MSYLQQLCAGNETAKFLNMNTQVGLSSSRVWMQFPWQWRLDSIAIDQLPSLSQTSNHGFLSLPDGIRLLTSILMQATEVKLIATHS